MLAFPYSFTTVEDKSMRLSLKDFQTFLGFSDNYNPLLQSLDNRVRSKLGLDFYGFLSEIHRLLSQAALVKIVTTNPDDLRTQHMPTHVEILVLRSTSPLRALEPNPHPIGQYHDHLGELKFDVKVSDDHEPGKYLGVKKADIVAELEKIPMDRTSVHKTLGEAVEAWVMNARNELNATPVPAFGS